VEEQLSEAQPSDGPTSGAKECAAGSRARGRLLRAYALLTKVMKRTVLSVASHDCLNVAQSTAYSAIVALFPALIVAAAVIGLLPDTAPVRFQLSAFFDRILPPDVSPLLDAYFQSSPKNTHTVRVLVGAGVVSFLGASNVIATLMEGFRRARGLPVHCWTFWQRRRRAFELVFLSLVPLTVASLLVVFGHAATMWLVASIGPEVRESIYAVALLVRWVVTLGASVGLIGLIYHLGVPTGSPGVPSGAAGTRWGWWAILPGAVVATAMWFLTTLAFGWYVTRFANYSEVYGSLGAGIALLFWLYIISLSVLCGAEFNAQFDHQRRVVGEGAGEGA
jgi:membrane protein